MLPLIINPTRKIGLANEFNVFMAAFSYISYIYLYGRIRGTLQGEDFFKVH